jgi:putative transport protein
MIESGMIGVIGASGSVAQDLAILSLAVTVGLAVGAIPVRGLKLGIPGVLFSSLVFRQLGLAIDPRVLDFLRDFGLIVFMYAIGLQVGPGFGASLRSQGLRLNMLSLVVLLLGGVMTAALAPLMPRGTAPGLYCGAFTTTPGLAAVQETLAAPSAKAGEQGLAARAELAYSITYPFGIVGPMLVVAALRSMMRVKMEQERTELEKADVEHRTPLEIADIEVTTERCAQRLLLEEPMARAHEVVFTRLLRGGVVSVPTAQTQILAGDFLRAVGPKGQLAELVKELGRPSAIDLSAAPGDIARKEFVVTKRHALHRSLRELDFRRRTGVTIGVVHRAGVDLLATGSLRLAFADRVTAVGPKAGLDAVEVQLGNSVDALNHAQLAPIFLGIVVGVMLGSVPLTLPNLHGALHIGLAGGSLFAAIALSRLRSFGSIVWYMPAAANQLFRDFGLAIFLACVGFQAGDQFIQRAAHNSGLVLIGLGAAVTLLPVFVVACYARLAMRMNFITLSGWIAGVMASSTTLQFAAEMTESSTPEVVYAAVVPLAELMPIICAQILAMMAR